MLAEESFYDPRRMATGSSRKRASVLAAIAASLSLVAVAACGDDHVGGIDAGSRTTTARDSGTDGPGSAVQAACNSSCAATSGSCSLPPVTAQDCAALCGLGYALAPACATTYEAYVHCAGASPLLQCDGNSITGEVGVSACLNELGDYLTCAISDINTCLELPLNDAACTRTNTGPHARACIGTQVGCTLLTGTFQAGRIGVFCCP